MFLFYENNLIFVSNNNNKNNNNIYGLSEYLNWYFSRDRYGIRSLPTKNKAVRGRVLRIRD